MTPEERTAEELHKAKLQYKLAVDAVNKDKRIGKAVNRNSLIFLGLTAAGTAGLGAADLTWLAIPVALAGLFAVANGRASIQKQRNAEGNLSANLITAEYNLDIARERHNAQTIKNYGNTNGVY